jgi:hypothetical protein
LPGLGVDGSVSMRSRAAALAVLFALSVSSFASPADAAPPPQTPSTDPQPVVQDDPGVSPHAKLGAPTVPDPVTFFPMAPASARVNRPEAVIGFASRGEPATAAVPHPAVGTESPAPTAASGIAKPPAVGAATPTAAPAVAQVLQGHVRNDTDAGIAGASVRVGGVAGTNFANYTYADADGAWSMSVPAGTFQLEIGSTTTYLGGTICADTYPCSGSDTPVSFVVAAGATVTADAHLRPWPTISGTITGADGSPIANDMVADQVTYPGETWTAADGTYTLRVTPGSYTVAADSSGDFVGGYYSTAGWVAGVTAATQVSVGVTDHVTGIDIQLPYRRTISGVVTDDGGDPLPGIAVTPYNDAGAGQSSYTYADGTFSLSVASTISWTLSVADATHVYQTGWYGPGPTGYTTDPDQAVPIAVDGSDVAGIAIEMSANPRISGRITGPDQKGIGGLSVQSLGVDGTSGHLTTSTAPDGTYSIPAPQGSYAIFTFDATYTYAPGYYSATGWHLTTGDAVTTATADVTSIDIELPYMQTISGTLTDPDGAPVAGITVSNDWTATHFVPGHPLSGTSRTDGSWTVKLPPGDWPLEFGGSSRTKAGWYGSGGWVATQAEATLLTLSTAPLSGIDVILPYVPIVSGTVRDAGGNPAPYVAVNLRNSYSVVAASSTAIDGTYQLFVPAPGSYTLETPETTVLISSSQSITVGTSDIAGTDITVHRKAVVTGLVQDSAGNPLSGITVTAPYSTQIPTVTNSNGRYQMVVWPAGSYRISFSDSTGVHADGWLSASGFSTTTWKTIDAVEDFTEDDTVVLPTYRHLTGTVTDPAGAPVADASLTVYSGTSTCCSIATSSTTADGSYDLRLTPGPWYVTVRGPSGFATGWLGDQGFNYRPSPAGPVTVPDVDSSLDFTLPHVLTLGGRVTHGTTPLEWVEVDVLLNGAAYASTWTDADGNWAVPAAPGAYLVGVFDPSGDHSHGWVGPSGFTLDPNGAELVTVGPADAVGVDVSLPLNHTVSGTYKNTAGSKYSGAYVEAWVNGIYYGYTSTKYGGTWSLPIASGKVKFWVYAYGRGDAPGWRTSSSLTANYASGATTIVGTSSVTGVSIVAPRAKMISGTARVSTGSTYAGVYNTFIEADAYGAAASFVWSGTNGAYKLPVLSGTYALWADTIGLSEPAPYAGGWYTSGGLTPDYLATTKIAASSSRSGINMTMWQPAHITGTVRDSGGFGIPSAMVAVFSDGYLYDRVATSVTGAFSITVPPGTFQIGYFDQYGAYAEGWLGASGYTPNYGSAKAVVMAVGDTFDGSIALPTDTPPAAPSGVTATPYHLSALVSWTPPGTTPDRPIIHSTVTADPGGRRCTAIGASSCTVTGLADGTAYTFTVTATTNVGSSAPSAPSAAVTPAPVPNAPAKPTAEASGTTPIVSWTAPADNGNAITGYTVTASPGGATCSAAADATSCQFDPLDDGWYTFTVTADNALGDGPPSPASAAAAVDTTAPVVGKPTPALRSGVTMSHTSVPVTASWTATDAVTGVGSTSLALQVGSGAYNPLSLASSTATIWSGTIGATKSLHLQAGATDANGNGPTATTGSVFGLYVIQEASTGTAKYGTWSYQSTTSALGHRLRYTTSKGAYMTYTFYGHGVAWVAKKGTAEGKAAVYLDGKLVATIDLHATKTTMRWVAWQRTNTTYGKHVLKIKCLGTSGHSRIDVDAFLVLK